MWYNNVGRTFFHLSQSAHLTDRQKNGRTDGFLVAIRCIALHVVTRTIYCKWHYRKK